MRSFEAIACASLSASLLEFAESEVSGVVDGVRKRRESEGRKGLSEGVMMEDDQK